MKQKSAIEKSYAEGLLKLSSVYGSKKIAAKVGIDSKDPESHDSGSGQTVFQLWLKVLEENEKVANLRLAAAQVRNEIKSPCSIIVKYFDHPRYFKKRFRMKPKIYGQLKLLRPKSLLTGDF